MTDARPAYHRWYSTARWQRRRLAQLQAHPLCHMCEAEGRTTPATVANHTVPHRGDPDLFWRGALDSLCKRHHDSDVQSKEKGGKPRPVIGADGWPVEPGDRS